MIAWDPALRADVVKVATGIAALLSVAWLPLGGEQAVKDHEQQVLDYGGVVLEYGQLYGPGTYYEHEVPGSPRIHVEEAALSRAIGAEYSEFVRSRKRLIPFVW